MKASHLFGFGAVFVLALAACETRPEALSSAATTSSKVVRTDAALQKISQVRCDRELSCGRVGEAKRWKDRDACLGEVGHPDLKAHPCPQGLTHPRLDECLADIGKRACDKALDQVDSISSCERKALCFGE